GIIIDGAVVIVEAIFAGLAHKSEHLGMKVFNKRAKFGWIRQTATEMGKPIFFSKVIIILALMPIFAFQKVEGKMFSPLAYTLGFALLGALIFTLTLVPMLTSVLLKKSVRERDNPVVNFFDRVYEPVLNLVMKKPKQSVIIAVFALAISLYVFRFVGTEFLPHLDEGDIWVRSSLPMSVSLSESVKLSNKIRRVFLTFPEVKQVISQTGRPDDGTDATGFFNEEFAVNLRPKSEWKGNITKEELIRK